MQDSLAFYDEQLRDQNSGQYYDATSLEGGVSQIDYISSVASTGMGMISLAIGHATGMVADAKSKIIKTLVFAQGLGSINGVPYIVRRTHDGWLRHWFDARTGADNAFSRADGFSTIDTTILVASAQLVANYFASTGQDADGELRQLADRLLLSVNWSSAVADLDKGYLYMNYDLETQKPLGKTAVFNEYALLACVGSYAEQKQNLPGVMTQFWDRHYRHPETLPVKNYQGFDLLTDYPGHYLSSFTIQFAMYLCGNISQSSEYLKFVSNAQQADKKWFSQSAQKPYLWGLGAGEVRYRDLQSSTLHSFYQANSIDDNQYLMVSPHIVAGFLPVYPQGIDDLLSMYKNHECLYTFAHREILWRCSLLDLALPMDTLQAIDYSSMFLGLATIHLDVGMKFFSDFAVGTSKK